jgi:hypothetical protein
MSADLTITLTITDGSLDELRALRTWLTQEEQLRGRVILTQDGPPGSGTLGMAMEALSVSIESGGAVTVLVAGIMSWIRQRYGQRHRASTTVIKLRRADGAMVEISAATAGTWSSAEIAAQIRQLVGDLDPGNQASTVGQPGGPILVAENPSGGSHDSGKRHRPRDAGMVDLGADRDPSTR